MFARFLFVRSVLAHPLIMQQACLLDREQHVGCIDVAVLFI
jgi:hypothetical protein